MIDKEKYINVWKRTDQNNYNYNDCKNVSKKRKEDNRLLVNMAVKGTG